MSHSSHPKSKFRDIAEFRLTRKAAEQLARPSRYTPSAFRAVLSRLSRRLHQSQ